MAFTAVGALIAGEAVTATLVLSAVAEVGMAMTVVGGVVGSKDLMKIGAAMSLVGGVGGMIAGATSGAAGAAGAAADSAAASGLAEIGADAATSAAWSEGAGLGADTLANVGADASSGILGGAQTAGLQAPLMPDASAAVTPMQPPGVNNPSAYTAPSADAVSTPAATAGQGAAEVTSPATTGTPYGTNPDVNAKDALLQRGAVSSPMNAPESSGNFFSRMGKFANDNKTLFSAGLQLAGGALKGANDTKMWNEKMAFQREQAARANSVGNFAPRAGIIAGARA